MNKAIETLTNTAAIIGLVITTTLTTISYHRSIVHETVVKEVRASEARQHQILYSALNANLEASAKIAEVAVIRHQREFHRGE
jgi:hypothetical protein